LPVPEPGAATAGETGAAASTTADTTNAAAAAIRESCRICFLPKDIHGLLAAHRRTRSIGFQAVTQVDGPGQIGNGIAEAAQPGVATGGGLSG
jgi:hypothetical protein